MILKYSISVRNGDALILYTLFEVVRRIIPSLLMITVGTVESITPSKMARIRGIVNSSAMDILYYTSPLYRSEVYKPYFLS